MTKGVVIVDGVPPSIEVGPFTYTVQTDQVAVLKMNEAQATRLFGAFDERTMTITIDTDGAPGQIRDTLLHETLHGLLALTGLAEELGTDREERLCRALAPALLDALRRNPALVQFLVAP